MSSIILNSNRIKSKVQRISRILKKPIILMLGNAADIEQLTMNSALFNYIFGYEFPNTLVIIDNGIAHIFTSRKKVELFSKVETVSTYVLNRDLSNLEECLQKIRAYPGLCVFDQENIKGDFCKKIMAKLQLTDATREIASMMLYKEADEINVCKSAGVIVNHTLKQCCTEMKDGTLNVDKIKDFLSSDIGGIDSNSIETSFEPVVIGNSVSIGVRYKGYCAEVGRTFFVDMSHYFSAQDYILGLIKIGESSEKVYKLADDYLRNVGIFVDKPFLYSTGLLSVEQSFEDNFVLQKGTVFVIKLSSNAINFSNTFMLNEQIEYITQKDTAKDYIDNRPRFRDKTREYELDIRRKEHQRELLDKLIKDQIEFYSKDRSIKEQETNVKSISTYSKETQVPRTGEIVVDDKKNAIVIPISDYAVPFHISTIKNVVSVDDRLLKFNFNTESKILNLGTYKSERPSNAGEKSSNNESDSQEGDIEVKVEQKEKIPSIIKSVSVPVKNAKFVYDKIQEMKNKYNATKDGGVIEQESLKLKQKRFGLEDLLYKADFKTTARKKKGCTLELHENGFRYAEDKIDILFSNIRYIFFHEGDIQNKTLLHFNLINPILIANKKTKNIQFYRDAGFNTTHNTQKRIDDHMDYIIEKEEEDRQFMINQEFSDFINKIEGETSLRVTVPTKGFSGVPFKEAGYIYYANECLVSLHEQPFFVLPLEEVEIVNFERVVFNVKTCDIVFILKNKSLAPVKIVSVDTEKMNEIKDYLDSNNIVFMSTIFNIHWKAVLKKIMDDPVSFYTSGGWSELMVEDNESESEVVESTEDESSESDISSGSDESAIDTDGDTEDEEESVSEEEEDSDYVSSDDESSDHIKKKVRR